MFQEGPRRPVHPLLEMWRQHSFCVQLFPKERTGAGKLPSAAVKGQPVAEKSYVESHHCTGCKKLHKIVFIFAGSKASRYCSKAYQVKDWANHKQIGLAINEFSEKG